MATDLEQEKPDDPPLPRHDQRWRDRRRAPARFARPDALSDRELRDIGLLRTHRPEGRIVRAP